MILKIIPLTAAFGGRRIPRVVRLYDKHYACKSYLEFETVIHSPKTILYSAICGIGVRGYPCKLREGTFLLCLRIRKPLEMSSCDACEYKNARKYDLSLIADMW